MKGIFVGSELKCELCHIGTLHVHQTTYTTWVDTQLITLPNVLTLTCDVCGEVKYDTRVVADIEALLGNRHLHANETDRPTASQHNIFIAMPTTTRQWSV
jgi:YgiT-type zinc finger domain-containing protein